MICDINLDILLGNQILKKLGGFIAKRKVRFVTELA